MKVHICNHMRKDIIVHRIGCADIERDKKRRVLNSDWVFEIPEGKTIRKAVVDDLNEDFGWDPKSSEPQPWHENNITIMPCCDTKTQRASRFVESARAVLQSAAKVNSASAQQKEKVMTKKKTTAADVKKTVAKNNAKVRAAMKATGVVIGEAMTPDQMKNLGKALSEKKDRGMTFNLFTVKGKRSLHTPSCKRGDRMKTKGTFKKIEAKTADDAAHIEGKDIVFDTDGNFVESDIAIHSCCKLFREIKTTNPPCPHCGSSKTVFRSNIGVGRGKKSSEFTCTACKKMFVHKPVKKEKEPIMKIRISKKDEKAAGKKSKKTDDRAAKRAARKEAREQRREARKAKQAERQQKREERKVARTERLFGRVAKMIDRIGSIDGVNVKELKSALGAARQEAGLTKKAKSDDTKKSKRSKK